LESFVIQSDGEVPRQMAERYGRELTLSERFKLKIFGLGFFKPMEGHPNILSKWFELKNFSVRPHLDQLTKGIIFRLRGTKEIDALAIEYSEIEEINIIRHPDTVMAIPLTPYWILIKLGFKPRYVRFLSRFGYHFGNVEVTLILTNNDTICLEWNGRHDKAVYKFCTSKYLKSKAKMNAKLTDDIAHGLT
jgi:hypothetical protein